MFKKLLVALDGSLLAERALPYALTLARASGGVLRLTRVATIHADPSDAEETGEIILDAERYLGAVRTRLAADATRFTVEATTLAGDAAASLLKEARRWGAEVLVVTTHGRSGLGRWLFGSVADDVLRHADLPVLLVPAACDAPWSGTSVGPVVVPLDGSELALTALNPAGELADTLGADLELVHAIVPALAPWDDVDDTQPFDPSSELVTMRRHLTEVAAILSHRGLAVSTRCDVGPAVETIAGAADERHASAIALATHGRSGLARVVMGSVATGLVHRARVPLLILRAVAPVHVGFPSRETLSSGKGEPALLSRA